jgi:hypothetical protein
MKRCKGRCLTLAISQGKVGVDANIVPYAKYILAYEWK